jgi:hypothetical protein
MWSDLRIYLRLAVMAVVVVAAAAWLPRWLNRVQIPEDYDDMSELQPFTTCWLAPGPYIHGSLVAFRHGPGERDIGFGRVAAVAGEVVELRAGKLLVAGAAASGWTQPGAASGPGPDLGPAVVPAGHLFVISARHRQDSTVHGMISLASVHGQVRE